MGFVENQKNVKKLCSFYVSDFHLVTMILPYISKKLKEEAKVETMLDKSISKNVECLIKNLNLNSKTKEEINQIGWNEKKPLKYGRFTKEMESMLKENGNIVFFISGSREYIDGVNRNLDKWLLENKRMMKKENKYITIVNCYEVLQFNDNIKEILDKHDKILNTSGEKEINEVFAGYTRKEEKALGSVVND
ncbi:MAG: hypothetical protein ACLU8F_05305 [Clostridia bacterium]